MFGNCTWFELKEGRSFLPWAKIRPIDWRGRAYQLAWSAVVAAPGLTMLTMGKLWECMVWVSAAGIAWMLDHRAVAKEVKQKAERDALFFIGDEATSEEVTPVTVRTANYELQNHLQQQQQQQQMS